MRPFEALTLVFAAASLLPFLLPPGTVPRFLRWLPLSAALAMILHLLLEGLRWQMLPAYGLVLALVSLALLSLRRREMPLKNRRQRVGSGALALLWLALAAALPFLLPVPHPLAPTGPYAVGTRIFDLQDDSRPEIFDEQVAHRQLMVQVWYPGQVGADDERAPFIDRVDVAGPAIAQRLNLPPFILGHLDLVRTSAYLDVPVAQGGPFPLLVFSHGLRGLRVQNVSLMQELASHGYVVAAADHTYANVITVFPDDRVVFYAQDAVMPAGMPITEAGARLVDVWAQDLAFVVQQLDDWSQTAGDPFEGKIDASRLGLLGHSTGAGAAIQACPALPECDAVVALDGWIEPVAPEIRDQAYERPLMLISAPDWLGANNRALGQRLFQQRQEEGFLLTVDGTVHFDFSDIPLMSPATSLIGLSGEVAGPRVVSIVNQHTLAFFEQTLKGEPSPLLQGGSDAYPEVSFWP